MTAVEHARWLYREWADAVMDGPDDDLAYLQVEAASVRLDCVTAAERRPYPGPSAKLLDTPPGLCSCAPKCDRTATRWDGWGRGFVWCDDHSWSFDPPIRAALEARP